MTTTRLPDHVREALDGARSHAAALARAADAVRDRSASEEPAPTPKGTYARAHALDHEAVRATLTALAVAKAAGRLEGLALALQAVEDEQAARLATARAAVQAEAERDVRLYLEDLHDNPEQCPTWEAWCREAFEGQWVDEWEDRLGAPRDLAERWHRGAFELALGAATGAPVGVAGLLTLAQREADARAWRESDAPTEPAAAPAPESEDTPSRRHEGGR